LFKAYELSETFKQVAHLFLIFSPQLNKNKVSGLQREPVSAEINVVNIIENNSVKDQHHLPDVRGFSAELLLC